MSRVIQWCFLIVFFLFILSCDDAKIIKDYYPTGELKAKYRIENEELHGTYYEYYKSGSYKEQSIYQNGKLNGIRRVYYENGKLDFEANYKKGKKHGVYKEFSSDGKLLGEGYFKNDLQDSITRWFYPDGSLEKEIQYKNGIKHGTAKFYYINGQVELFAIIENGITMYSIKYSENGDVLNEFRDLIINMPDTVCTDTKFEIELTLKGPEINNYSAIIEVSNETDLIFHEVVFKRNVYNLDTVFSKSGKYSLDVYYWIMDKPYISPDSIIVINCSNSSNGLSE